MYRETIWLNHCCVGCCKLHWCDTVVAQSSCKTAATLQKSLLLNPFYMTDHEQPDPHNTLELSELKTADALRTADTPQ